MDFPTFDSMHPRLDKFSYGNPRADNGRISMYDQAAWLNYGKITEIGETKSAWNKFEEFMNLGKYYFFALSSIRKE